MEPATGRLNARAPDSAAGFEQMKRADDVGVDEIARTGDGAIDVRFGGQMQDMRHGMLLHDFQHGGLMAEVHLLKSVFGMMGHVVQIDQVAPRK